MDDASTAKAALRREMRALRRVLPDTAERSTRIWAAVQRLDAVEGAAIVMAYDSIVGEPDTEAFMSWCRGRGQRVVLPEDDPTPEPGVVDVVIVPGLAFTSEGDRLGQGGGWYDRFLADVRPDCVRIGVGFDMQVVDWLPTEVHDVRLDLVVTDGRVVRVSRDSPR